MMRVKAKRKKHENATDSEKSNEPDNEQSQSTSVVAIGILMLIVAGGCFVCAYAYLTAGGTSCHLDFGGYSRISGQIFNVLLRGICSIFDTSVSDKNKPMVGSIFFAILGFIALVISWRTFSSVKDNSKDYSKF